MGTGAAFVHHLNCRNTHNHTFQAFAGVAGTPKALDITPSRCQQSGVKPLLMIHGTNDRQNTNLTTTVVNMPALNPHNLAAEWANLAGAANSLPPTIHILKDGRIQRTAWSK